MWLRIGFTILACYSLLLLGVEWQTSQDYVRNFFSDVEGPTPFFAVNTTLSVTLLWATALMFAVCLACSTEQTDTRLRLFFATQLAVFAYLGLDDRFKLHETIAGWFDIGDHYVLATVAMLQVGFLLLLGRQHVLTGRAGRWLRLAASLFVVMLLVDAKAPHEWPLRLSVEDLAKTWAGCCFFLFAWELFALRLGELKSLAGAVSNQFGAAGAEARA